MTIGEWVPHCDIDCGMGAFYYDCPACKKGGALYDVWDEKYTRIYFKCEKCETALESDWDSDEMEQWVKPSLCKGCQRPEVHKRCPAHGTPFYCTGVLFSKETEELIAHFKTQGLDLEQGMFEYLHKAIRPQQTLSEMFDMLIENVDPKSWAAVNRAFKIMNDGFKKKVMDPDWSALLMSEEAIKDIREWDNE
tara:strand:+ start:567 stop:1145 length:579 start_codon:yes stop_codon:yes gene_type:complete